MKLALNLAAVLLLAAVTTPASAQRGAAPGAVGMRAGGSIDVGMRGNVDAGRVASRDIMRIVPGDNHHARRRWNAANDANTGTRIRRPGNYHARRRWNAANGNNR